MRRKYFNLLVMLVLGITFFSSSVSAEIKTYTGVGEHYMENETESLDYARTQSKLRAELNALEQALSYIESYSRVNNFNLSEDEIISIAAGIFNVLDEAYSIDSDSAGALIIKAVVVVEIDEDRLPELLEREIRRRRGNL